MLAGEPRAVARAISIVEQDEAAAALVRELYPRSGRAAIVGMTGPPGAGKSTLVDRLIARWRAAGRTVGVLAIDPSSPYSGGAMLGDRVRMQTHARDEGVFIRSMATRGHLGGLARATGDAATILDASGKDVVVIETVGVGQDEVEIAGAADVSVLVLVPGAGDDVQVFKAGVMEIADVFVVNKSDRDDADRVVAQVESLLSLQRFAEGAWRPPIVKTTATTGDGVELLASEIGRFVDGGAETVSARRRARAEGRVREILAARLRARIARALPPEQFDRILDRVITLELDPYAAADLLDTALERT